MRTLPKNTVDYSPIERLLMWLLAAIGLFGLNTVFVWYALTAPELLRAVLENPMSVVLLIESFLLMGLLAFVLTRWRASKLHWGWFIFLSLLGTMAFSLPFVLLWPRGQKKRS